MVSTGAVAIKCRWAIYVTLCALSSLGCDREQADKARSVRQGRVVLHPAQGALERHLDAYIYGDMGGAFRTHIASVESATPWCGEAFSRVLAEARLAHGEEGCASARVMTSDGARSAMFGEEEQLLAQTLRFVCEHGVSATCVDYSRKVYESGLTRSTMWTHNPSRYVIKRMQGEGDEASAYVDIDTAGVMAHEHVELVRVDGVWFVRGTPGSMAR